MLPVCENLQSSSDWKVDVTFVGNIQTWHFWKTNTSHLRNPENAILWTYLNIYIYIFTYIFTYIHYEHIYTL